MPSIMYYCPPNSNLAFYRLAALVSLACLFICASAMYYLQVSYEAREPIGLTPIHPILQRFVC